MIRKIPTQRFSLARMINTPAFAWALYIGVVVALIVVNLEKFA